MLRHTVFERFDKDFRRYMRSGGELVNEDFCGVTDRLSNDALNIFVNLASQLLFEEAEPWID